MIKQWTQYHDGYVDGNNIQTAPWLQTMIWTSALCLTHPIDYEMKKKLDCNN
jgi:GH25 family lysozyme M1 (1,4-beta-N-acetylmuramidase)